MPSRRRLIALATLAATVCASPLSLADEYVEIANQAASAISGTMPAEDLLFPALLAMQEPPVAVGLDRDSLHELLLLSPGDRQWRAVERWAMREPQREAIEVLAKITDLQEQVYLLGIPYGVEGVDPEWIEAGLYAELGPGGLLYGTKFHYQERLSWIAALGLFEAARLASEGEGEKSLETLVDLTFFCRLLAERAFAAEKAAAFDLMFVVSERYRDVIYTYEDAFDHKMLKETAIELDTRSVEIDKVPLPEADKLAAEQIVALAFEHRGKAESRKLAGLMAEAGVTDRPLRLFSEAAWWRELAANHADWFDSTDEISHAWNDYMLRWSIADYNDRELLRPSHFLRTDPARFPVVYHAMRGIEPLFTMRKDMLNDIGATYNSLGITAFKLRHKKMAPQISAIQPKFVKKRAKDYYNIDDDYIQTRYLDYRYWVPIRDQEFDRREEPHPHVVTVRIGGGSGDIAEDEQTPQGGFDFGASIPASLRRFEDVAYSLPNWGITDLDTSELVSQDSLRLDVSSIRRSILDAIEKQGAGEDAASAFTDWFAAMIEDGIGPFDIAPTLLDTWDGLVSGLLEEAQAGDEVSADNLQVFEDAMMDLGDSLATILMAAFETPSIERAFETVGAGGEITPAQVDELVRETVEGALDQSVVDQINGALQDPIVAGILLPGLAAARQASAATSTFESFTASVDDTQFMLYSIGSDGIDGRAVQVGISGSAAPDILFWPPVIALERENNR